MMLLRHIPFLKAVFLYSFTAFGGPQGHMGMMIKTFVQKRKDVTEDELVEYNSFCQMLPGPSSTQTVMLIALKRGGIPLALVTLLVWVSPAAVLMGLFSFIIHYYHIGYGPGRVLPMHLFSYVQPMSVGFVFYAATRMMQTTIKHVATATIMVCSLVATLFINSPWVFPVLLLLSGIISNFSNRRIPDPLQKPKRINWMHLGAFAGIFIVAGVLSELARTEDWAHGRIFNIFENFYRFGAIVFGGGQALLLMMTYQFVSRHGARVLTAGQMLTGYGIVQAMPGPVFSVCSYVGGLAMSQYGGMWQLIGCVVATVAVFLPSTLLLFFLFPVYENLKHHVVIFRALEGINAAIVGIVWASGIFLFRTIAFDASLSFEWSNLIVVIITFCLLYYSKIPPPFIVLGWLLLGWSLH
ncbi:chromate transporter [Nemorincola caseinilytica]|uniref:Chromate transporter n=1 Tax=Nemorincola caseinilytica TaxID=2054315 RepID=A0ABP8N1U0_9BACT